MKIVILNEVFLQQKHIETLKGLGEVEIYEHTDTEEKVIERARGAEVVIADCWESPLNKRTFEGLSDTKYLCIGSTGFDLVDVAAAKQQGILVANIPGFSTDAVAEHTFALLLAVVRHVVLGDNAMRKEPFLIDPANETQQKYRGTNLRGKTLGVVGLGQIGQCVAGIAQAFGMRVVAYNRSSRDVAGVELLSLEEVLRTSDVVSLHLALTDENKEVINEDMLVLMKPTAYLINTARSGLIAEEDLVVALRDGQIAGAGLDVVTDYSTNNPLLSLQNVVLTPHAAFFTEEALEHLADILVANVKSYVAGSPESIVNA